MRLKARGNHLLWLRAYDLIDQPAILENQQCRNASDIELTRSARILVNVQLCNLVTAAGFGR